MSYHVDVRFGELGAEKTHNDVPRLTALPTSSSPIVVFVGVLKDGVTAVFLVTSEAVPHGEGSCKPDKNSCTYIYMKAGETETLDVPAGTAGLAQYELKVLRVHKTDAPPPPRRPCAPTRASPAPARDIIAAQDNQLLTLRYSRLTGKLYPSGSPRAGLRPTFMATGALRAPVPDRPGPVTPLLSPGHGRPHAHHRGRVPRPRAHLHRRGPARGPRARPRGDRPRHGAPPARPRPRRAHEDRDATPPRSPPASATGARSAARSRSRSPTATTRTGRSG